MDAQRIGVTRAEAARLQDDLGGNLMPFYTFLAVASMIQAPEPIFWLDPNGAILVEGKPIQATLNPGTLRLKTTRGVVYDFDGRRSGINLPDIGALALTDSFTVSTWLNLRKYWNDGPGAQVFFRGDDRNGLDPFTLVVHGDGTINFSVQNENDRGFHVCAEMPLNRWTHVLASWDKAQGQLRIWMNGVNVGIVTTTVRPFATLDRGWAPGIGIGNVQNEKGPHNQPINGQLSDLRVYRGVWTPDDIFTPRPGGIPPAQL